MKRINLKEIDFMKNSSVFKNPTDNRMIIRSKKKIVFTEKEIKYCKIIFRGEIQNAGGYLIVNDAYCVPINSTSVMPIVTPMEMQVSLVVLAESELCIDEILFEGIEYYEDLAQKCAKNKKILVVTPDYPSSINLYLCAFAHSRNREYLKAGLEFQVASISARNWYETTYTIDGVQVLQGNYETLKKLLNTRRYKTIVTHFVEENLYSIYEGYTYPSDQLIFICHGPETTYRFLENITGPYFTSPVDNPKLKASFDLRDKYIKKFSRLDNVEWVFVSNWLRDFSEKFLNVKFRNSQVISNVINEKLFPYVPKKSEQRKKILILRKFDNIMVHSVDQSVRAILELSKRDFFDQLDFEVYGDGDYYDVLLAPIKRFKNVHLHRTFIPNDKISDIHKECGILLIPSRHDSQGVAMGEGAASGLVVVGSNVTCVPYFMGEEKFHTLADPENPVELADIIERLYRNPDDFLRISEEMSKHIRSICNISHTVKKEIELIKQKSLEAENAPLIKIDMFPLASPVLSIVVPAYNVEKYIEKCIMSLLNHRNAYKTEIIIVNDGSTDNTLDISNRISKLSNGIVKVVNKDNGGHGSTINVGIERARGKYFRLIDGDDWVDSDALCELVDILEKEDSDIVLSTGSYAYIEKSLLEPIVEYDTLKEKKKYKFEDLIYYGYGFMEHGPLLSTSNYKTKLLKKAGFKISEKKPYVDMEFNAFSIRYVNTLTYYNLDIYRYLIGRQGQTVSKDFWKRKYKDHEFIIFNILDTISKMNYTWEKEEYVFRYIVSQMVNSQIFMFDTLTKWDELDDFLNRLKKYRHAYDISLEYISSLRGNSQLILKTYKQYSGDSPIIIPGIRENVDDMSTLYLGKQKKTLKWYAKKGIKCLIPYGILRYMNRKR